MRIYFNWEFTLSHAVYLRPTQNNPAAITPAKYNKADSVYPWFDFSIYNPPNIIASTKIAEAIIISFDFSFMFTAPI